MSSWAGFVCVPSTVWFSMQSVFLNSGGGMGNSLNHLSKSLRKSYRFLYKSGDLSKTSDQLVGGVRPFDNLQREIQDLIYLAIL
jgi:hypothetical protein